MAAKAVFKSSLPSLPDEPNHPSNFTFPKRSFGKTKPVFCADQLDLRLVANEYITKNETRQIIFATFKL